MTTETLRKLIKVTDWSLTSTGLTISYERDDSSPKILHLILTPIECIRELSIVGSIEDYEAQPLMAIVNANPSNFNEFIASYKFCQWEALSIVLRHEAEKELANDLNILEIDECIKALR